MARTAQGATFDSIYALDGFESRDLLEITLPDNVTTLYLASGEITTGGHAYEPDISERGEPRFSAGGNPDGAQVALQNADGSYSITDSEGVSPLEGARYVYKRAVAHRGQTDWQVDTIDEGAVRGVAPNGKTAVVTLVSDMSDPSKVVSGEVVTLEELTPIASEVTTTGGGGTGNGWREDGLLEWWRRRILDRDRHPVLS